MNRRFHLAMVLALCQLVAGAVVQPGVAAATAPARSVEQRTPISAVADFDGARVHYVSVGKAETALIFIHGWGCSARFWKRSQSEFPGYRVISIDLPGHGDSDKPQVAYSMDYFARSVESVMQAAGIRRAVLVGHSMGVPVIRQFYRLYPAQTLALVLVDGPLRADTKDTAPPAGEISRANYSTSIARLVEGLLTPIRDVRLREEIRSTMLATPEYVGASIFEELNRSGASVWRQDGIAVPVLSIMAQSMRWKIDTEQFYRSIAPDLDFQMWEGVGHFLMMERPEEFNSAVRRFLQTNALR